MRTKHVVIILVVLWASTIAALQNDYMTFAMAEYPVVAKIPDARNFYLVLRSEEGERFSVSVGPATYTGVEVGGRVSMSLRPFDVRQTFWQNLLLFFGPVLVASVTFAFSVYCLACVLLPILRRAP